MAWLAELLGLPAGWHGHLEEGASLSTLAALAAAREAKPGARVVVCSEHAHSSVDKACRVLELELRKVPADAEFRLRPDAARPDRRLRRRRHRRHDVEHVGRPGRPDRRDLRARRRLAARRRRLRGLGDDLPRAALGLRRHRARRLARRQPAQVAAHAAGLLGALDAPARGLPRRLRARARVSADAGRGRQLQRVQPRARPPFRALKLWAVLRHYGAEGLRERIRESIRLAAELERWIARRPGLGAVRAAPVLGRLLPPARERRGERRPDGARQRGRRDLHLAHEARRPLRAAPRDRQRAHHRGRRAPRRGTPCAPRPPRADQLSGAPTGSTCPVTPEARPLARKSAAAAISSGVASRRSGVVSRSRSSASSTLEPALALALAQPSAVGLGGDRARPDRIDADAARPELERDRADEAEHGVLARGVAREHRAAAPRVLRCDHDDRAVVGHRRERLLDAAHDAARVDGEDVVPFARVERLDARPGGHDAGGGHEHVDRPQPRRAPARTRPGPSRRRAGRRRSRASPPGGRRARARRAGRARRRRQRRSSANLRAIAAPMPLAPPVTTAVRPLRSGRLPGLLMRDRPRGRQVRAPRRRRRPRPSRASRPGRTSRSRCSVPRMPR